MIPLSPIDETAARAELPRLGSLALSDIEAMRSVLAGASVIDFPRLSFADRAAVDAFLRVLEFRPDEDEDQARLWALHAHAVQHLELNYELRLPRPILHPAAIQDLLLWASRRELGVEPEIQRAACMLLKVMHIVNHLDARELGFLLPISDRQLFALAEDKVLGAFERMQASGLPIVEAVANRKLRDSLVTKLLAKRENIAAQIYDKLRVRIVTRKEEDVLPVLHLLISTLFPFNYVIPGESRNRLIDLRERLEGEPQPKAPLDALLDDAELARGERPQAARANEFSGQGYRDIAFVLDLPLRVPDAVRQSLEPGVRALGPVVFALVEIQVLHEAAHLENERGDGSHDAYKRRQQVRVLERLGGVTTAGRDGQG